MPESTKSNADVRGAAHKTGRGWSYLQFKDAYGHGFSLEESSECVFENEDGVVDNPLGWIWLGLDAAKPQIMKSNAAAHGLDPGEDVTGWMPYPIPKDVLLSTRMYLSEDGVRGLMAKLQHWLDTGEVE